MVFGDGGTKKVNLFMMLEEGNCSPLRDVSWLKYYKIGLR
jgi:hypothetical protein